MSGPHDGDAEQLRLAGLGTDDRDGFPMPECPQPARPDCIPANEIEGSLAFARADVRQVARGSVSASFWRNFWHGLEWQWTLQLEAAARNYEPTEQITLDDLNAGDGGESS